MTEPRAWTAEEVREQFLKKMLSIAEYWATNPMLTHHSHLDRCEGVVHSILAVIDGRTLPLPAFDLIPASTKDDRAWNRDRGENWYEATDINDGALTEQLFRHKKT